MLKGKKIESSEEDYQEEDFSNDDEISENKNADIIEQYSDDDDEDDDSQDDNNNNNLDINAWGYDKNKYYQKDGNKVINKNNERNVLNNYLIIII